MRKFVSPFHSDLEQSSEGTSTRLKISGGNKKDGLDLFKLFDKLSDGILVADKESNATANNVMIEFSENNPTGNLVVVTVNGLRLCIKKLSLLTT